MWASADPGERQGLSIGGDRVLNTVHDGIGIAQIIVLANLCGSVFDGLYEVCEGLFELAELSIHAAHFCKSF